MATLQKVKLGDVCVQITDGKHGDCVNENNSGYFFISSKDVFDGAIHYENARQITKADFLDTHKRTRLEIGDILITNSGTIGRMALVKNNSLTEKTTFQKSVAIIKSKRSSIDNTYLYYKLLSLYQQLVNLGGGSAQHNLLLSDLRHFTIQIPNFPTQTHIASVLSAYDDLIENNEKRIKVLEEMAQLLYTEWFVKFKFPRLRQGFGGQAGQEKVKMVESGTEYGKIPEGWDVRKLKEIGKVVTGKTPSTSKAENFGGKVLFIKTPDIHRNIFVLESEETLSEIGAKTQSLKMLPKKTVFVSCIGTIGVVGITSKPSQTNQQINALLLNDGSDYCFFYCFAQGLKNKLVGLGSNGATMGNVNKDKFENINILYPKEETRKSFFEKAARLFDEILLLQKYNKNLSITRDLLIPQLVTGKRELK